MEKLCTKNYVIGACLIVIVIVTAIIIMSANSQVCSGWLKINCPDNGTPTSDNVSVNYINASADDIVVTSPQPGTTVAFPIPLSGQARGPWYFEADAPVRLVNEDGDFLVTEIITAEGEWMTENFVPFSGQMDLENVEPGNYVLLFQSSNPSDLPELDKFVEVPIVVE